MKHNNQENKSFNLTIRFIMAVFLISIAAGMVTIGLALLFHSLGIFPLTRINPFSLLWLNFFGSLIIGILLSVLISKITFSNVNKILKAVHKIGKGNFDIELDEESGPQAVCDISKSINIMAKELKNLEILRTDFVHNFSHEFKTPIVSIQGFTKRLLTKELTEEQKSEYLNIILEESTRLALLATNTLYMSKLDSMERIEESKAFMLDEQIRQSILLLEKYWESKQITFQIDIPIISYYGNEDLLKQIWINIINNAIKFSTAKGEILVSGKIAENDIIISITDFGIGMSSEILEHIFDKFYQGDASHAIEGNGLGLSIVKKIIDLAKGTITVRSEQNQGSTFIITLPKKSSG